MSTHRTSEGGVERQDALHAEFQAILLQHALTYMKRRGSNTLDESDFSNAYNELLSSQSSVDWVRQIAGNIVLFAGGVVVSAALGFCQSCTTTVQYASVGGVTFFGFLMAIAGIFIQLYPHWKK